MRLVVMCVLGVGSMLLGGCTSAATPLDAGPSATSAADSVGSRLAFDQGIRLDALLSQYPDAEVPDVELVRTVTLEEWPTTMAACLTEQGFPSTVVDGGVDSKNIGGQEEAKEIARYLCNVMYPLDPKFNQPLSKQQLDTLYAYYSGELTRCLEDHGFSVDAAPSRQQFGEQFNTEGSWSPYLSIAGTVSGEQWTGLNKDCPQVPEGLYD